MRTRVPHSKTLHTGVLPVKATARMPPSMSQTSSTAAETLMATFGLMALFVKVRTSRPIDWNCVMRYVNTGSCRQRNDSRDRACATCEGGAGVIGTSGPSYEATDSGREQTVGDIMCAR